MGADGGVAGEGAVLQADGDRAVVGAGVAEGEGVAGQDPVGDPLRLGGAVAVAVPVQDAGGDADAADGEAAGDGGDDPQVVAAGGEGVGGDPVVERVLGRVGAGVRGGWLGIGDAQRTSFPLISTTGSPPGTGHWTLSAGTTIATPVETVVVPKVKESATWTPGRSARSSSTVP